MKPCRILRCSLVAEKALFPYRKTTTTTTKKNTLLRSTSEKERKSSNPINSCI
jgi:hypothetical protein